MQETELPSLDQEESLEKEMATHSSILAWEIPWTEESGGLQSVGLKKTHTGLNMHRHRPHNDPPLFSMKRPNVALASQREMFTEFSPSIIFAKNISKSLHLELRKNILIIVTASKSKNQKIVPNSGVSEAEGRK